MYNEYLCIFLFFIFKNLFNVIVDILKFLFVEIIVFGWFFFFINV